MGCVLIALLVPFSYLDEVISAGILIGFNMTNAALLLIRCGHTPVSVSEVDSVANITLNNDTHSLYRTQITRILNIDTNIFKLTSIDWGCISCSVRYFLTTYTSDNKEAH